MYKSITCWIIFLISFYSFSQNDSIVVEEYDTIIVVKEPLVIEQKVYVLKQQRERDSVYSIVFYGSYGVIFNYMNTCDCYSKKNFTGALKSESYFSFNTAITKKIKKRFGVEVGLSVDYMKQSYAYSDTASATPLKYKNNTLYAGALSHVKYYIIPAERKINVAVYAGVKGLFILNQSGSMYNIGAPDTPASIKNDTKSTGYGLSGRLEANIKTGRYAKIIFGLNYYYDLTSYTLSEVNYYLQRNIAGAFVGYRIGL